MKNLLIALLLLSGTFSWGQNTSDDGMSAQEEQRLRDAGKKLPPAKLEKLISGIKARRQKAGKYRSNPDKTRKELMTIIEKMRNSNSKSSAKQFAAHRAKLGSRIYWLSQNRVAIPADVGNQVSEALIDIYEKRASYSSTSDHLPITTAAKYGNSARVKKYLIKIVRGADKSERSQALSSLARSKSLRGDSEIYAVLENELLGNEENGDLPVLGAMKNIDSEKTLPHLLAEVDSTSSVKRFIAISGALSQYRRPELLERVIRRVNDFPKKSWTDPENPTLGIDDDALLQYIKDNDGDKLELALTALDLDVTALRKSVPAILEKLDKGTPQSRHAVAKFLGRNAGIELFRKTGVIQEIQKLLSKESDPKIKSALTHALIRIRKGLKGGGHE